MRSCMTLLALLALLALPGMGCGVPLRGGPESAPTPAVGAAVTHYDYTVRVDAELTEIDVTVCFDGVPAQSLSCLNPPAAVAFRRAEVRSPGRAPEPLERTGRQILVPPNLPAGACVGYVINIRDATDASMFGGMRAPGGVMLNGTGWLWAPRPLADGATGTLHFELPPGVDAAVAFPREGDGYRLPPDTFQFLSHTVFGRFSRREVPVPGGVLDVVRLGGPLAVTDADLDTWLTGVGHSVSQISGRFPVERALAVVIPVARGDGVVFGNAGRGGGPSVMLLVGAEATLDDLRGDWVPPHEFTHLAMPYVGRRDAWMSEGIATYYQEVLRARGGVQSPLEAWRALDAGFISGRESGTGVTLDRESARMRVTYEFRRVYWAGTALAFLADIALREEGSSLDAALVALDTCCRVPQRVWRGREVARVFDQQTGHPVYEALAEQWLSETRFPDVESRYEWLGLRRGEDGLLELVADAPGAALRDSIMSPLTPMRR